MPFSGIGSSSSGSGSVLCFDIQANDAVSTSFSILGRHAMELILILSPEEDHRTASTAVIDD